MRILPASTSRCHSTARHSVERFCTYAILVSPTIENIHGHSRFPNSQSVQSASQVLQPRSLRCRGERLVETASFPGFHVLASSYTVIHCIMCYSTSYTVSACTFSSPLALAGIIEQQQLHLFRLFPTTFQVNYLDLGPPYLLQH